MVDFATNSETSTLNLNLLGKFDKKLRAIVLEICKSRKEIII